mmetsp:Transcript_33038/g.72769  ORF Transcript_33038/g.72769 Transcript_33038/m.72769 type:complete len:252 (-) Transcript_33038:132-887(-)
MMRAGNRSPCLLCCSAYCSAMLCLGRLPTVPTLPSVPRLKPPLLLVSGAAALSALTFLFSSSAAVASRLSWSRRSACLRRCPLSSKAWSSTRLGGVRARPTGLSCRPCSCVRSSCQPRSAVGICRATASSGEAAGPDTDMWEIRKARDSPPCLAPPPPRMAPDTPPLDGLPCLAILPLTGESRPSPSPSHSETDPSVWKRARSVSCRRLCCSSSQLFNPCPSQPRGIAAPSTWKSPEPCFSVSLRALYLWK